MPNELLPLSALTKADAEMSEVERLIAQGQAEDENAYSVIPTRVKIAPGGIGQYVTEDGEAFEEFPAIVAVSQIARAYWPERGTGKRPFCSSPDGNKGIVNLDADPDQYRAATHVTHPHAAVPLMGENGAVVPLEWECAHCPMNAWASAHQGGGGGRGKACKELRRLVILVHGWTEPAMITLPPTSLRAWDAYCSALGRKRSSYFAQWTRFTLENASSENGEPFSVVKVKKGPPLTVAELTTVLAIRKQFASLVRELEITGAEYEVIDGDDAAEGPTFHGTDEDVPF